MSVVISISGCTITVTITPCTPSTMFCNNIYSFTASSDFAVNTNVLVDIFWYGDLGGFAAGTVTIPTGNICNSTTIDSGAGISCFGENVSNVNIFISPSSSGNQIFISSPSPTFNLCPC